MSGLTLIIGKDFAEGSRWLRKFHKEKKLDPQKCRVVTNPDMMRGLQGFNIYWLPGWVQSPHVNEIRDCATVARVKGNIGMEFAG